MMRIATKLLLLMSLCALVALTGCERGDSLLGTGDEKAAGEVLLTQDPLDESVINGFNVHYDGRSYDDGQTTFRWTVTGTGEGPSLDFFMMEVPDCAGDLVGWMPEPSYESGIQIGDEDIYGRSWFQTLESDDLEGRQYALTFAGKVAEGVVRAVVNAGEESAAAAIYGPCNGFEISGIVYVDGDEDGFWDPDTESGIDEVVVEIIGADQSVQTVRTAPDGSWSIIRPTGTYTVRVDTLGYPGAFNPELGLTFNATTSLDVEVTVGPDATDVDFGFAVDAGTVIEQLEEGVLPTSGESRHFWKQQLRMAEFLENRYTVSTYVEFGAPVKEPFYDKYFYGPEQMHIFMDMVRNLYLPDPYMFDPETEFSEAYQLLSPRPHSELEDLIQQLLVAELNFVSDQGITGERAALLSPLLAWGESVVAEALMLKSAGLKNLKARDPVRDALLVFKAVNTGGGNSIDD